MRQCSRVFLGVHILEISFETLQVRLLLNKVAKLRRQHSLVIKQKEFWILPLIYGKTQRIQARDGRIDVPDTPQKVFLFRRLCSGNPYLTKFAPEDEGLWVYLA